MSGKILWGKWFVTTSIIMGVGYGLLAATTPTEEEWYNSLSPDLKRKVDEVKAMRAAKDRAVAVNSKLEAASEDDKIVWGSDLQNTKNR